MLEGSASLQSPTGSISQPVKSTDAFNLESISEALTLNLGSVKKIDGKPIIQVKSDERLVLEKFRNGQLLARMLCDYTNEKKLRFDRLIDEISELKAIGHRRVSSTTFLDPRHGMDLYRHMGLLLDAEKCRVRHINTADASMYRLGDNNKFCTWNRKLNTYTCSPHNKENEVSFSGKFRTGDRMGLKIESLEVLRKIPLEKLARKEELIQLNEVVVDYNQDAILGVIATPEIKVMSMLKRMPLFNLKQDCIGMQLEAERNGLIVSNSFLYDPKANTLTSTTESETPVKQPV
ncbi:hypothetical protein [Endozoicomonas elysicola]|uniref:Uncharacterized protein n=1 Tax=Endozoicomonas elysicola TaxID=305900 RepID=A0A081KCW9_9GAMM|nr:hypothetical protein [Endozoicomonas elysicola]KEI71995.1 hypothetical protein GV64_15795 [Endozoicomonas elysicola]